MAKMTYTFARNERKFLITRQQRDALLGLLGDRVRSDEWGRSTVRSLYCDTPSDMMIRHSLEHPTYKEKIRIRAYGVADEDGDVFLELKQKVKGVTYKRRATMGLSRALSFVRGDGDPETQIEREIAATVARYARNGGLRPAMLISCEREAFFATDDPSVRLTFDEGIRWSDTDLALTEAAGTEHPVMDDDLVLLEIKCGPAMPLWLVQPMSSLGLKQTGFSKYGVAWRQLMVASGKSVASDGLAPIVAHARLSAAGMQGASEVVTRPATPSSRRPRKATVTGDVRGWIRSLVERHLVPARTGVAQAWHATSGMRVPTSESR